MSGDRPTCRLMDDGLPCEYHRGLADGAAERDALAAKVARVEALADEWADFDHDAVACPKFDCGDCTMLNAIFDIRAALRDQP